MAIEGGKSCYKFEKKNLISTRMLGGEGCVTTFTNKTWKVNKGALVIEKGENVGTLYLCNSF